MADEFAEKFKQELFLLQRSQQARFRESADEFVTAGWLALGVSILLLALIKPLPNGGLLLSGSIVFLCYSLLERYEVRRIRNRISEIHKLLERTEYDVVYEPNGLISIEKKARS